MEVVLMSHNERTKRQKNMKRSESKHDNKRRLNALSFKMLKQLWILSTHELNGDDLPNPSMLGRYVSRITMEGIQISVELTTDNIFQHVTTCWGCTLTNPIAVNHYRQFWKRASVLPQLKSDEEVIDDFRKRLTQPKPCDGRVLRMIGDAFRRTYFAKVRPCSNHSLPFAYSSGVIAEQPGKVTVLEKLRFSLNSTMETSRVTSVPKDWKGPRIIACEPAYTNWLQHGFMADFRSALLGHPLRITTEDQGPNRLRCNEFYDSVDMSNASDRVMTYHVAELCPPTWKDIFLTYRTPYTKIGETEYVVPMYGTMGCALTFDAETIVFRAIIIGLAQLLLEKTKDPAKVMYLRRVQTDSRVYGDDIVIPHSEDGAFIHLFLNVLDRLGFEVNSDKSYWLNHKTHSYRETCGVEYIATHSGSLVYQEARLPRGATASWLRLATPDGIAAFLNSLTSCGCQQTTAWAVQHVLPIFAPTCGIYTTPEVDKRLIEPGTQHEYCWLNDPLVVISPLSSKDRRPTEKIVSIYQPTTDPGVLNIYNRDLKQYTEVLEVSQEEWDLHVRQFALANVLSGRHCSYGTTCTRRCLQRKREK
jgi:hypothetical protein